MAEYRFEEMEDGDLQDHHINQFAAWANGAEEYGAPINPVLNDDDEYNSFQNKGEGGSLGLLDSADKLVFWAQSVAGAGVPDPSAFSGSAVKLYGPDGTPILTEGSLVIPPRLAATLTRNTSLSMPNGDHIINFTSLVKGTSGYTFWDALNPSRLVLPQVGLWLIVFNWKISSTYESGWERIELHLNGVTHAEIQSSGHTSTTTSGDIRKGGPSVYPILTSAITDYVQIEIESNDGTGTAHLMEAGANLTGIFLTG